MTYPDLSTLCRWLDLNLTISAPQRIIRYLLHDSRQLMAPESTLFVALGGARHDGHDFIPELYQRGVRAFLVHRMPEKDFSEADFLFVPDVLSALQKIATRYRKLVPYPVLGITGSNGKTTIKEWLRVLLAPDYRTAAGPGSWNSQVGVPLSVYRLDPGANFGIIETGISQSGEMSILKEIVKPDIGLFTNLGSAHADGFLSNEEKLLEKLQLFEFASTLFINSDQGAVNDCVEKNYPNKEIIRWSRTDLSADLLILEETLAPNGTLIRFTWKKRQHLFSVPFTTTSNLNNALHCLAVMCWSGISFSNLEDRFRQLPRLSHRLRIREGIEQSTVIDDTYSFDLHSFRAALDVSRKERGGHRPLDLIISDPRPSNQEAEQTLSRLINQHAPRRIFLLFAGTVKWWDRLREEIGITFSTPDQFITEIPKLNFGGAVLLVKGARRYRLEQITNRLCDRVHRTALEIDLEALIRNLHHNTRRLPAETKVLVMVKANAYGAGAIAVARQLSFHRVDYLGVAFIDEGVKLRKAGIQTPILVLNPESAGFQNLIEYKLEAEIYSIPHFRSLLRFFRRSVRSVPVQIKLDTGMHRLGFTAEDLPELLELLKNNPEVVVSGIFTHLAAADLPEEDAFTQKQIDLFQSLSEQIIRSLGYRPLRHVLNSAGINRFPQAAFEMVRLGLNLYQLPEMSMRLRASISQIKHLAAGETVGYSRRGKVSRVSRIATVGIGYGDGIPRLVSNGKFSARIGEELAPIIGNVCMDMCMLDVTDLPDVKEGDEVVFFGPERSIDQLAHAASTISYEILAGISGRVKRVYHQ